jgi:hypothetical protein
MNATVISTQGTIVKSASAQNVTSDSEHVFAIATKKFRFKFVISLDLYKEWLMLKLNKTYRQIHQHHFIRELLLVQKSFCCIELKKEKS